MKTPKKKLEKLPEDNLVSEPQIKASKYNRSSSEKAQCVKFPEKIVHGQENSLSFGKNKLTCSSEIDCAESRKFSNGECYGILTPFLTRIKIEISLLSCLQVKLLVMNSLLRPPISPLLLDLESTFFCCCCCFYPQACSFACSHFHLFTLCTWKGID